MIAITPLSIVRRVETPLVGHDAPRLGGVPPARGKLANVAIPHWLFLFLDIIMYPCIPHDVPQLFFTNQ